MEQQAALITMHDKSAFAMLLTLNSAVDVPNNAAAPSINSVITIANDSVTETF